VPEGTCLTSGMGRGACFCTGGVLQYATRNRDGRIERGAGLAVHGLRRLFQGVLAACVLGRSGGAGAAADPFAPGQTDFLVGVEAFHAGYYDAALAAFEQARAAGFAGHTLDFNTGLADYKLGRYPQARAVFERLLADPEFVDVAEFHLGLVAARQGQQDLALRHLRRVQGTARSAKLKALAQAALERVQGRPAGNRSNFYASAGLGYDSNPVLLTDNSGMPGQGPDWFGEAFGALGYSLASRASSSDQLRANVYLRQYHHDTDLSQQDGSLAVEHSIWGQGWRLDLGLTGDTFFVGGENLQSSGGISLQGSQRIGSSTLALRYQGSRVAGGGGSTYLDGWQQDADLIWSQPLGPGRLRLDYAFEANARRDLNDGAEFFSESPARHGLGLRLVEPLSDRLTVETRAAYRYTRYRDADRFLVDGVLTQERRTEKLAQLGASARYRLYPGWNVLLQYDYSHNLANIPGFNYSRHTAVMGLEWLGS